MAIVIFCYKSVAELYSSVDQFSSGYLELLLNNEKDQFW